MSRGRRAVALALGLFLGLVPELTLTGCHRVELEDARQSPYLRALWLPSVGTAPWNWRRLPGQVVVVSFFATWSFTSLLQLPVLQGIQQAYAGRGLQVVLVGMDLDGAKVLGPFAESASPGLPILLSDESLQQGRSAYGIIPALPATFLLDREGRVAGAWQGVASRQALEEAVEALLRR